MIDRLKRGIKELLGFVLIAIVVANLNSLLRSPSLNDQNLPRFDLELVDQTTFPNSSRKGSLVLYFWGSWCSVCRFQSPVISELSKTQQVLSFAVNSGSDRQVQDYLESNRYLFPTYNDRQSYWSTTFKVSAYPTVFIFDEDGTLRFSEVGYTSSWGLQLRLLWLELWS
ncbi:MAG: hypothetical protein CMH49_07470 [Myxococcales bacterium]|nr:hypothetical protein [Myxococcales bacterium]